MAFDPSVIGSISEGAGDPVGAEMKGITLKNMLDQEQLGALQVGQAKQQAAENAQVQNYLRTAKYSNPQEVDQTAEGLNKISPRAGMAFKKEMQDYQSGQIQNTLNELSVKEKRMDLIAGAVDPIAAQARAMKAGGASDLDVKAYIAQQMPGAMQQLRNLKLDDGKPALTDDLLKMATSAPWDLQRIEALDAQSKAGQGLLKQRREQLEADTKVKAESNAERRTDILDRSEREKETHDRAAEAQGDRRTLIAEHKAAGFDDREAELLASLADRNVSLPAGLRSQQQIKSTIDGLFAKHPDLTADQIADGIRSGKLKLAAETKGAQTAGTQIGKVALAANELNTFGDQTNEAAAAIPRGKFVPWNELKNYADSKISDPELLRFKAKMQALENAYNQLAARSGTDVDKRAHIHELFNAANSTQAVGTLIKALKEEAAGAREAADRTIAETSDSAIPGTGGVNTAAPAAATPTKPGAAPAANVVDWNSLK